MTTATIQTLARAAKPDREPADAVLRLHPHFVTDEPGEPAGYHSNCFAFEERKADLMSWADKQLESFANGSVRNLLSERDTVRESWRNKTADLLTEFISLGWQKRELLLGAGPGHSRQIAEYRELYENSVSDEIANLTDLGIDRALPASGKNERAAEHQLRKRVESQDWVLAAKADLNCALEAERIRKAMLEGLPTYQSFTIFWPEFDLPDVANLVGLARTTVPESPPLTEVTRRICRDFGLDTSPLLPGHIAAFKGLAVFGKETFHPLMSLSTKDLPAIVELVGQLPRTKEVQRFLADSQNGRNPYAAHII